MADIPPLLPSDKDVKNLTDYLSFQKQLTDAYKLDMDIMDKIGKIDRNLESNLKKKVEGARKYLNEQQRVGAQLQKQGELFFKVDSAHRAAILSDITSLKK
jgi:hypothetical protein